MNRMDWVGQTLGQYRIEAPLGVGGMGQVFRGMQVYLNRSVAIKVMQANVAADPEFRARFLQEAKAAAALRHPNIVEIYDFNEQDGHLYLVMELMTDGSLRTLLRRRATGQSWPLSLGLDLVRQAAEGLAAAHAQGMVHRDIKSDNLLLNRMSRVGQEPERYQLKIGDFGLARLAEGGWLTSTGIPMGTLAYMSPEQCQSEKLDGRSDLYALGVVLYEVATGSLPFQINNFNEAFNKHVHVSPLPPCQVRSDVPPLVEEIILRCMAKKPDERYATGTELAQALRRALGDAGWETVASIRLPPPPSAEKTVLQSPKVGSTPAPVVSTLPGASALSRVRVLDQNGQTLQVVEVTNRGLTIGRQSDNDIVLQAVSRQHVRVTWDGRQVTVTDLGSSIGTWLGEQRLLPQVGQVWIERQEVQIGPFWLRLEGSNPQGLSSKSGTVLQTQLRDATLLQRTQHAASMAGGGRIGVVVEPDMLSVIPGQPAIAQVTVVNLGSIVDWLTITVEGVAQEWVQGPSQAVQLNPGIEQTVVLNVNVARTANNRANNYPVTVLAHSRQKPDESGIARTLWTVLSFKEDVLHIEPRKASGRGKADYTIRVRNDGNAATRYALSGEDDEQKMTYRFGQNEVATEPGSEAKVPLTVRARRHWLGRKQLQPFQVHSRPIGSSSSLTVTAEFINKALLPAWVLSLVVVVLVASGLILSSRFDLLALPWPGGSPPTPTLTATTAPTDTPVPAPTDMPVPTPSQQAQSVVQHYFDYINNKDYGNAYNLWGTDYQSSNSYAVFASGYANTVHDEITIGSVMPQTDGTVQVSITIHAMETTGMETFQGYYMVGLENNIWKLLKAHIQQTG